MEKDLDLKRELAQHVNNAKYTRDDRTTKMSLRTQDKVRSKEEKAYITLLKIYHIMHKQESLAPIRLSFCSG